MMRVNSRILLYMLYPLSLCANRISLQFHAEPSFHLHDHLRFLARENQLKFCQSEKHNNPALVLSWHQVFY